MATPTLTRDQRSLGKRIREALLDARVPISFMMWYSPDPETEDFALLVETPLFNEIGPRATYAWLDRLFLALADINVTIDDITLILPGSLVAKSVQDGPFDFGEGAFIHNAIFAFGGVEVPFSGTVLIDRPPYTSEELQDELRAMEREIKQLERAA